MSRQRTYTPEQRAAKAEYDRARRARLKAEIAEKKRAYYLANKDKEDARVAAWCEANKDRSLAIKRAYRERNRAEPAPRPRMDEAVRRAKAVVRVDRWREKNPGKYELQLFRRALQPTKQRTPEQRARHTAHQSLRTRRLLAAQPQWACRRAIESIYLEAQKKGMHVDHIIPLQGKTVCGLHVEANLQLLPPTENLRKRNKFAQEDHHAR